MVKASSFIPRNFFLVLLAMSLNTSTVAPYTCTSPEQPSVTINNYGACGNPSSSCQESSDIDARMKRLERQLDALTDRVMTRNGGTKSTIIKDCSEVPSPHNQTRGIFTLHPINSAPFDALCMFDENGAWTVIQQRVNGEVDFQRCWQEYQQGFGDFNTSFYLGNDKIHAMTRQRQYKLRVELTDWSDEPSYAEYQYFHIENEANKYKIHYANYSGTAGDALSDYHQGMLFSTFDQDNDKKRMENCAVLHGGGWWFNDCDRANLHGFYTNEPEMKGSLDTGLEWDTLVEMYSFKKTRMRIMPTFPN